MSQINMRPPVGVLKGNGARGNEFYVDSDTGRAMVDPDSVATLIAAGWTVDLDGEEAITQFVANAAALPAVGEALKLYIALDTGAQYRWTGNAYKVLSIGTATDASGNVTGLVDPTGKTTRFNAPRNALRTVVCGNSIAAPSKFTTYITTKSIPHWGNIFGGSPFRFPRITASTRADLHGVYSYSGQTLATINADLPAQLVDPVNTAGWLPECVLGIGLLENSISVGNTVAAMKAEFNHWRRLMQTVWPGVMLVTHTPLPSLSYNTAAMVSAYQEMCAWLRSEDDGCSLLVFDGDVYEDPAAPGKPLSGYTDVSVHPYANAASMLGRELAGTMKRISNNWVQPALARYNNPALSGTGAASGTNVTGTVATSFVVNGSANGAFVATAEQPGQLVAVTGNSSAGPGLLDLSTANCGVVTTADTQISPFMELEIVSGAANLHALMLEPRINDFAGNTFHYFMQHQTNDYKPVFSDGDILTFVQPPQIANTAPISGCTNYIKHNCILAGGAFSYRVRKQGVIVVS